MTTIVTIAADSMSTIDANSADTKYIIPQGVTLAPPADDYAIDARQEVSNRSFEINGSVQGAIIIGEYSKLYETSLVTIGGTGTINTQYTGLEVDASKIAISSVGMITSGTGIDAYGHRVAITNTGTIDSSFEGLAATGNLVRVENTGTIQGMYGVFMTSLDKGHVVLHNTGTIVGGERAVTFGNGNDIFLNAGEVTGDASLGNGNDRFGGAGGVLHGVVHGDGGNDILRGGSHRDTLSGDIGNDVLTGRGGSDVFLFVKGFGKDTIADFDAAGPGHDVVDLGMDGVNSFADVKDHAHQNGNDVILNFGNGDTLTLHNVDIHDLNKADFTL